MPFTIHQVAHALGVPKTTIDKKISRGHFETKFAPEPTPGMPREWDMKDVVRLAAAIELGKVVGDGLGSIFCDLAAYERAPGLFLVATSFTSNMAPSGSWCAETINPQKLSEFLKSRGTSFVIDLDALVGRVKAALDAEAPSEAR